MIREVEDENIHVETSGDTSTREGLCGSVLKTSLSTNVRCSNA